MLDRIKHYLHPSNEGESHKALLALALDSLVTFSHSVPLPELAGKEARVVSMRSYTFGPDNTVSYSLSVNGAFGYHLTVIEDEQGVYLGISRELPRREWEEWFDLDALDFFLSPSSARILKLRPGSKASSAWSAPRYNKVLEAVEGKLHDGIPGPDNQMHAQKVEYSLLASDNGEKSIEIERLTEKQTARLYATIYRPQEDIISVEEALPYEAEPEPELPKSPAAVVYDIAQLTVEDAEEAMAPLSVLAPKQGPRPDFRRRSFDPIEPSVPEDVVPKLPSFLLEPKKEPVPAPKSRYISLDDIIGPEPERLRCDIVTGRMLIQEALARSMPVREVVRALLGMRLEIKDEVLFDLPLSENDYKDMALRYHLKPTQREEIRARLAEELRERLQGAF